MEQLAGLPAIPAHGGWSLLFDAEAAGTTAPDDEARDLVLELVHAREREPRVRLVGAHRRPRRLDRRSRRRDVGIQVLHAQDLGIAAGRRRDLVDREPGDAL